MKKTILTRIAMLLAVISCCFTPARAQFDEPSNTFWNIWFGGDMLGVDNVHEEGDPTGFEIGFSVNHAFLSNLYIGAGLKYMWTSYEVASLAKSQGEYNGWKDFKFQYHNICLPVELGVNMARNRKFGFNPYVGAGVNYCLSKSDKPTEGGWKLDECTSIREEKLPPDSGLGLEVFGGLRFYMFRHLWLGTSFHYSLNDAQKAIAGDHYISINYGCKF